MKVINQVEKLDKGFERFYIEGYQNFKIEKFKDFEMPLKIANKDLKNV